ncbi:MAG TPA: hypothetical protein VKX25_07775 [Bryobacteraceae bacterium]|jgi:hypothetical protein|nr:hypothetical protein [Bryobacteraceae bacterium]
MHVLDSAWETLKREFESASEEKQRKARRNATGELNRLFRRFRQYENGEQWIAAVRDGVALAAREFAIYTVSGGELRLRAQQGLGLEEYASMAAASASAFRSAIETREPVVTLRRASDVGEALALGEAPGRAHLVPILNGERVVAIVFAADGPELDMDALELVASMGSAVLERQSNLGIHTQIAPAKTAGTPEAEPPAKAAPEMPAWAQLKEEDRRLHARAQRFARVAVAKMQLARPEACRAGLEQSNLYMFFQAELDKARESYAKQFMTIPSMVDYLHLELLESMAAGEERNLGADYPGHLV